MLTKVKDTLPLGKQWYIDMYPLQLWPGLHRGDQTETGDETEGTPRCLREGDDGEASCSGACVGESPPNPLGGDHSAGPWQRTGAVCSHFFTFAPMTTGAFSRKSASYFLSSSW